MTAQQLQRPSLTDCVDWRPWLWSLATQTALDMAADLLIPGVRVLEIGYNTGLMSCYFAATYGATVVGYEALPGAPVTASETARRLGLGNLVDFRYCAADQTLSLTGSYDVVFLKSVLYHICEPAEYDRWLCWLRSLVRPGGCLIVVENGLGNYLTRLYRRRLHPVRWARQCLVNAERLRAFRMAFDHVDARFFGRFCQFFEPIPGLRRLVLVAEKICWPPDADSHFVAAIVARRYT